MENSIFIKVKYFLQDKIFWIKNINDSYFLRPSYTTIYINKNDIYKISNIDYKKVGADRKYAFYIQTKQNEVYWILTDSLYNYQNFSSILNVQEKSKEVKKPIKCHLNYKKKKYE